MCVSAARVQFCQGHRRDSLGNIVVAVRFPAEAQSFLGLLPINWTIEWHLYVDFEPCSIPEITTTTTTRPI